MLTAEKALEQVRLEAEKIRNEETAVVGTVSPGDVVRQGDLYVVCITGADGLELSPSKERQLAPGTTQGSRHVMSGKAKMFTAKDPAQVIAAIGAVMKPAAVSLFPELIGPVFKTLEPCELEHPEHGNRILPGGETYAVVYQRALADEVRRQMD